MNQLNREQLDLHVTILGWLHMVGGLFFVLVGVFIFFFLRTIGAFSGDEQAVVILNLIGTFVGGLLMLLGAPGIVAGFGLMVHKAWARYLAIVLGILNLVNFPIGTVIGAYTLWVLLQEKATEFFVQIPSVPTSMAISRGAG